MATTKFSTIIGSAQVVPFFEDWTTVTCTSSWTTNTTLTAKRMIFGANAYYDVNVALSGAPNSGDLTIVLPTGDVISTASMATPTNIASVIQGSANINDTGIRAYVGVPLYQNSAQIQVGHGAGTGNIGITNQLNPITFGAGDTVSVKFMVPLVRLLGGLTAQGAGLATSVKPGLVTTETSGTFNGNLSGNVSTGFAVCNWYKVGRMVTLEVDSITYTATAAAQLIVSLTNMPASARPRAASPTSRIVTQAVVSGTAQVAVAYAQPTILNFSSTITGSNWPASGSQTQQATVFSWLTD